MSSSSLCMIQLGACLHASLNVALLVAPAPKPGRTVKKTTQLATHDEDQASTADFSVKHGPKPKKRKANKRTTQLATESAGPNEVGLSDKGCLGKRLKKEQTAAQDHTHKMQEQQQRQQQVPGTRACLMIQIPPSFLKISNTRSISSFDRSKAVLGSLRRKSKHRRAHSKHCFRVQSSSQPTTRTRYPARANQRANHTSQRARAFPVLWLYFRSNFEG
jgi:hypothetical protein